ncbi:related to pisatin demethylase / cytochrome P450 monooxygenase [Ramularia collo-cygni]|uniref:Related to pisatin demethylase / cytochrome P450 monooxygenase n=1 Tax=Ramularia collo-cygni TaxID=112498 RepID=A0A2D3VAV8_9PEZI|nr:related to pisatin demethylase / cytochrome P450 monooxygenase [Ramularia collo-cygni]CZT24090.1 related to pisatin demethylase / cytochrome P450 monooxygenase [Ramularia collo-cygni]
MEHLIDDVVNLSLQQLHRYASERRTVRLDAWTMFFAYEVVSSLALGQTTGFLERGEDVNGIIESNHMGFWLNSNVGYLPGQSTWFANYYFLWFMTKLGSNFAAISDWIDGAVKDGRISQTNYTPRRSDLLQCFFEMTDMDGKPASDEEVASEIGNVLGAGADTTGTLIVAALRYLIANPDDYRRVQQEVDNEHRESGLSNDQEIKYASLAKLPFLCAVIQESLRLHPSIVYQLPRESLTSATMVGDYLIPPGVSISVSPTAANRSTEVFGLDANTWRPQRWIEKDESADSVPSQDSLMTFGRGSRGCLGKNLALVEAHKYIASFVRNFEASFKDPEYQGKIKSFFFAKIEDVEVVLVSRRRQ